MIEEDSDGERYGPVERLVGRDLDESAGKGRPLSEHAAQYQRSIEAYLKAGAQPRWMARVAEVDNGIACERRRLGAAYDELLLELAGDPEAFAARWRELARSWDFDELNVLVEQHNAWYPIERQLAVNPRTGEYVPVAGRSYRRPVLGAAWVLEEFPAEVG